MEFYKIKQELGDLVNDNVRKLESIFPSVVKDGEVDFEELKELLGDFKEVDKEKYEMNWVGKKEAKKIALAPLYDKTLKYIEGDGKNEDSTENLYIEGDNLEVLKLLQNSYYGKVKMIYIDPPYNTGNDFVYNDNFKDDKDFIDTLEGNISEYSDRLVKNQKTGSHFHSKWLSMMYSRLLVCKDILREDGVIFISIDDVEVNNLKMICNEVFGEYNFIANIIWEKKSSPQNDSKWISDTHDYILCYSKNKNMWYPQKIKRTEEQNKIYNKSDKYDGIKDGIVYGRGPWFAGDLTVRRSNDSAVYEIVTPSGRSVMPAKGRGWVCNKERFNELLKDNRITFGENGDNKPCIKRFLSEIIDSGVVPKTNWSYKEVGENRNGRQELKALFEDNGVFDSPKPTQLIKKIIEISNLEKDSIILDFFSGSGTLGQALMEYNLDTKKNSKFIIIQLPEVTDKKSEAYKAGYKNICEIGKERIRRAGDKILSENRDKEGIENLDIGFKVFRVENSNIRWQNQVEEDGQIRYDLDGTNIDNIDFVPGTKDIDVVYEILLRHYGIPLTAKIEKLDFIGNRTYAIQGSIIVCLETQITKEIVDKISELEPVKVIFRDSAFGDDISLKQNSVHRLNVLIEKNNKNTTHVVEFI